jgi:hypothetical protein
MAKNLVMLALIALVAIEHDGETVAPGEVFELDEKQAQPLIDVGAARLQEPADEPEAGGPSGDPASGDGGTGDGSAGDSGAGDGGNAGNGGTAAKTPAAKTTSKKR